MMHLENTKKSCKIVQDRAWRTAGLGGCSAPLMAHYIFDRWRRSPLFVGVAGFTPTVSGGR